MEKLCKNCDAWIATKTEDGKWLFSSDYVEGTNLCRVCLEDYCMSTNCLGCQHNPGNYRECKWFGIKKMAIEVRKEAKEEELAAAGFSFEEAESIAEKHFGEENESYVVN